MGYDIDVCMVQFFSDKVKVMHVSSHMYISYNWTDMKKICLKHYLEGSADVEAFNHKDVCDCRKISLWYTPKHIHGRKGKEIKRSAKQALEKLKMVGILPYPPSVKYSCWGVGTDGKLLPRKERLTVLASIIQEFRDAGKKYPDHYFIADVYEGENRYIRIEIEEEDSD